MWYAKGNIYYLNNIVCLDTETSHNNICGWIYQWAVLDEDALYYGRKPSEIIELLKDFVTQYNLDSTHKMVIYVHQTSMQWLIWQMPLWHKELMKQTWHL